MEAFFVSFFGHSPRNRPAEFSPYDVTTIEVEVQSVPAADWYLHLDRMPQARYGWLYPVLADTVRTGGGVLESEGNKLALVLCPQLISKQTGGLGNAEFHQYLDAIAWMCDRYIMFRFEQMDASETLCYEDFVRITTTIEDELYDLSPPSLSIFSRVQLSALDS